QVKLGVAGPITGGSAAFGAQLKNGVEQAVTDINAAGGILGQKIQVFVGDDRADPKEGVSVANKFVGDGVKFVVGHFNSGVTIPSSEVLQENGILKITAARADLVYWGGLHDTGGLILRQLRDQGVQATFMGADGITDDEFAVIAGPGAEGTLMTFSPDPRNNPANKAIIDVFRKKGFEPQAYTLYSYAAV